MRSLILDLLLPACLESLLEATSTPGNVKDMFPGTPAAMLVMLSWVYHAGICHGFFPLVTVQSRVHGKPEPRNGRSDSKVQGSPLQTGQGETHPSGIVGKQSVFLVAKLGSLIQ